MSFLSSLSDPSRLFELLIRIPIVLLSLTVHEVAHGYTAYKLGDPTARNLGRLSLNPLKHLDPLGALCMLLFKFGWAKPVPINTRYFKKPKRDMALTALAGPVSNLLMAFVGYIALSYTVEYASPDSRFCLLLAIFFSAFYSLNISLAVFNFIPVPPLDGSRILFVLLPDKAYFGVMKYERYISIGILIALYLGLLDTPLYAAVNGITFLFYKVASLFPGL